MATHNVLDHTASKAALVDLLMYSNDAVPLPYDEGVAWIPLEHNDHFRRRLFVQLFTAASKKPFKALWNELRNRDIRILRDGKTGRALRVAQTSRVLIRHKETKKILFEVSRTYTKPNGETVVVPNDFDNDPMKRYSISETNRRKRSRRGTIIGEKPLDCAIRGITEELKIKASSIKLNRLTTAGAAINIHWSSVYRGIMSRQEITYFRMETSLILHYKPLEVNREDGVVIAYEWHERDGWFENWPGFGMLFDVLPTTEPLTLR